MSNKDSEPLASPEEEAEFQAYEKKIKELDNKLSSFGSMTGSDPEMDKKIQEMPTINKRGNRVYSNKEILENYKNAIPPFGFWQLPYCKDCILGKIKFWFLGGFLISVAYEQKKLLEAGLKFRDINLQKLGRTYMYCTIGGAILSTVESLFFDDFCDVNSIHYRSDMSVQVKKQILKDMARDL